MRAPESYDFGKQPDADYPVSIGQFTNTGHLRRFVNELLFFWRRNCLHGYEAKIGNLARENKEWKMRRNGKRKGFTLIEIMLGISILGLLAALSIPAILKAYTTSQEKAKLNNIAAVEKAKGILSLPSELGMVGAMGLTTSQSFNDPAVSNLCKAMGIKDMSELSVGGMTLRPGTLTERAYYE
jgi:prepilin-type N-terminal cleavage/methylation domain-containing protein